MKVELPLRIINSTNAREHHMARARRVKRERAQISLFIPNGIKVPCTVTLTRIAPRPFDSDGNVSAFKGTRDAIAQKLGINDNSPLVTWTYKQERGKPKMYSIRIEIAPDRKECV
ncbi:hypothetical protein [Sphingomonas sp.]|uniref:hypothetical protein n=1 Tax=Sphingomonas sp. TaxID=28214 RepID=UPI003568E69E